MKRDNFVDYAEVTIPENPTTEEMKGFARVVVFAAVAAFAIFASMRGFGTSPSLVVACVGDSITAGGPPKCTAPPWMGYPGELAKMGFTVENLGIRGATTDVIQTESPRNADYVILMAGTNDLLFGKPRERALANIDKMIRSFAPARVIVMPVPDSRINAVSSKRLAFNISLRQIANDDHAIWLDPGIVTSDLCDGLHPFQPGYKKIADALAPLLK